MNNLIFKRGEVVTFDGGLKVRAVILQNNIGNKFSKTTIIAYIFTGRTTEPYCAQISQDEFIDCRTITTVDLDKLSKSSKLHYLDDVQMHILNETIKLSLGRISMGYINSKIININNLKTLNDNATNLAKLNDIKTLLFEECDELIKYLESVELDYSIVMDDDMYVFINNIIKEEK